MARQEADREDLLGEATAFVRRIELQLTETAQTIVAGFRRDGRFSLYFGGEPVYHFDRSGRLQRAFHQGAVYRVENDALVRLRRQRNETATLLLRRELTAGERAEFQDDMRRRLLALKTAVDSQRAAVLRQVPSNDQCLPADVSATLDVILIRLREAGEPAS